MSIITVDFETYFSQEYGFSKHTTEEYVRDDRFEVIGVAVKVDDGETEWFSGTFDATKEFLMQFDWENSLVLAHNTLFDGAILTWHFGIKPMGWLDTLSMARATEGVEVGNSLAKLADRYAIGTKGDDTRWAKGLRRQAFTPQQLAQYGQYCKNDVDLTYTLFGILKTGFTKKELKLIDLTLRMFTEPSLVLNLPLLEQHLVEVVERKEKLIAEANADRETLLSNQKFADALVALGVEPPRKVSPTTGKVTLALAKNDEGFKALAEHPDERVQALVAARLGTKSTLEETRTQRFIDIAKRGKLPVPLRYYAAHTGRWGGDDKLNLQNLPSRGKDKNMLKRAICPPPGYVIVDADSSQIEARIVAWLSGQKDLVKAFEEGRDVYKIMAAQIYNKDVLDVGDSERFVGKTTILGCFSADTLVLTSSGWKRIVEVQATDMLWDGEEWVRHQGVVPQGVKQTIRALGVDATPEHEILTEHGWWEWSEVTTNPSLIQSAINKGSLLSLTGSNTSNLPADRRGGTLSYGARVDGKGRLIDTTSRRDAPQGATPVRSKLLIRLASITGVMKVSSLMKHIERVCLTVSQAVSRAAIDLLVKRIPIMGGGVSLSTNRGVQIESHSYDTLYHCPDGMTPSATSTVPTTEKDTNPETCGSLHVRKMQETNEQRGQCRQRLMTYDIAYAGPRNRYTIATTVGAFIVHNCGYGMGAQKFQMQLMAFGVWLDIEFCKKILHTYRTGFPHIPKLWDEASQCLHTLAEGELKAAVFGTQEQAVHFIPGVGFEMPSGIPQKYPGIKFSGQTAGFFRDDLEIVYDTRKGVSKIYGGKAVENICQGLARCVIGEQMLKIAQRYKVVLTVHDAVACIAPEAEADEAARYVQECMRWRPKWAETLPLNCEVKVGSSYGDAVKWKG